jgi:hypothetical protein
MWCRFPEFLMTDDCNECRFVIATLYKERAGLLAVDKERDNKE